MTLFAKPRPESGPHADLYQVAWVDKDGGKHANTGLDWDEAAKQWADHIHIVGNYGVHITAQGGAG